MSEQVRNGLYFHVGNSGFTFAVLDNGMGPEVEVSGSAFGHRMLHAQMLTTKEGLEALGRFFLEQSQRDFSAPYCHATEAPEATFAPDRLPPEPAALAWLANHIAGLRARESPIAKLPVVVPPEMFEKLGGTGSSMTIDLAGGPVAVKRDDQVAHAVRECLTESMNEAARRVVDGPETFVPPQSLAAAMPLQVLSAATPAQPGTTARFACPEGCGWGSETTGAMQAHLSAVHGWARPEFVPSIQSTCATFEASGDEALRSRRCGQSRDDHDANRRKTQPIGHYCSACDNDTITDAPCTTHPGRSTPFFVTK
jgi:hypothetical protein